jgi:hypothetical protein
MIAPLTIIFSFLFGGIITSAAWYVILRYFLHTGWREMLRSGIKTMPPDVRREFLHEVTSQCILYDGASHLRPLSNKEAAEMLRAANEKDDGPIP